MRTLFDYGASCRRWALVQTNYDPWLVDPIPKEDGACDHCPTEPALQKLGLATPGLPISASHAAASPPLADGPDSMSIDTLWTVLGSKPNLRETGATVWTSVYVPLSSSYEMRFPVGIKDEGFERPYWAEGGEGHGRVPRLLETSR